MGKQFFKEAVIPRKVSIIRNASFEANLHHLVSQHSGFIDEKKKYVNTVLTRLRNEAKLSPEIVTTLRTKITTDTKKQTPLFASILFRVFHRDTIHLSQPLSKDIVTDFLQDEEADDTASEKQRLLDIIQPVTLIEELGKELEALDRLSLQENAADAFLQDLLYVLPFSEVKKIITWYKTFPMHQAAVPERIFYPLSVLSAFQEAHLGGLDLYQDLLGGSVPAAAEKIQMALYPPGKSEQHRKLRPFDFRPYVKQQSSESQSIPENVSNSHDSYVSSLLNIIIGRYGLGALTNLRHLNGKDSFFKVSSKNEEEELKAFFMYNGYDYFVSPERSDSFLLEAQELIEGFCKHNFTLKTFLKKVKEKKQTGTLVEVKAHFTDVQQQHFFDELPKKFKYMPHVRILVKYKGKVLDINRGVTKLQNVFTGESLSRDNTNVIFVDISENGYKVLDLAKGFNSAVFFESFIIPGRGTKPFIHEDLGQADLYTLPEKGKETDRKKNTSTRFQIGGVIVLELLHAAEKCGFVDQVISLPSSVTVDESRSHMMVDERFQRVMTELCQRIHKDIADPVLRIKHFSSLVESLRQIRTQRGDKSQEARMYAHFALNVLQPIAAAAIEELQTQGMVVLPNNRNFLHAPKNVLEKVVFVDDVFLLGKKKFPFERIGYVASSEGLQEAYGVPLKKRQSKQGNATYRPVYWESAGSVFLDSETLHCLRGSTHEEEVVSLLINNVDSGYISPIKIKHSDSMRRDKRQLIFNDELKQSRQEYSGVGTYKDRSRTKVAWDQVFTYKEALESFLQADRQWHGLSQTDPVFLSRRELEHQSSFAEHVQHVLEGLFTYPKEYQKFVINAFMEAQCFSLDMKQIWIRNMVERLVKEDFDIWVSDLLHVIVLDMDEPWTKTFLDNVLATRFSKDESRKDLFFIYLFGNETFVITHPLGKHYTQLAFEHADELKKHPERFHIDSPHWRSRMFRSFLGNPSLRLDDPDWNERIKEGFSIVLPDGVQLNGKRIEVFRDFFGKSKESIFDDDYREMVDTAFNAIITHVRKKKYEHDKDEHDFAIFHECLDIQDTLFKFVMNLPKISDQHKEIKEWLLKKLEQVNEITWYRNCTVGRYVSEALFSNTNLDWSDIRVQSILEIAIKNTWEARVLARSWYIGEFLANPQLDMRTNDWARKKLVEILEFIKDGNRLFTRTRVINGFFSNPTIDLSDPWIEQMVRESIQQILYLHSRNEETGGGFSEKAKDLAGHALATLFKNPALKELKTYKPEEMESSDKALLATTVQFLEAIGFDKQTIEQVVLPDGKYIPSWYPLSDLPKLNPEAFKLRLDLFKTLLNNSNKENESIFFAHKYLWNLMQVARDPNLKTIMVEAEQDIFAQALIYFEMAQTPIVEALTKYKPNFGDDNVAQLQYCCVFSVLHKVVQDPERVALYIQPLFHRSEKAAHHFGELKDLLQTLVQDLADIDVDRKGWKDVSPATARFIDSLKKGTRVLPEGERETIGSDHANVGMRISEVIGRFREGKEPLDRDIPVQEKERYQKVITQAVHSQLIRWDVFVREVVQNMRDEANFTQNTKIEIKLFEQRIHGEKCLMVSFRDHGRGMSEEDIATKFDQPGQRDPMKVQSGLAEGELGQGQFSVPAVAHEHDIYSVKNGVMVRQRREIERDQQHFVEDMVVKAQDTKMVSSDQHGTTQVIRLDNPSELSPQLLSLLIDNAINLYVLPLAHELQVEYQGEIIKPPTLREVSKVSWNGSSLHIVLTPHNQDGYERITRNNLFLTMVDDPKLDLLKYVDAQFRNDLKSLGYDLQIDLKGLDVTRTRGGLSASEREIEIIRKMVAVSIWSLHASMNPQGECKTTPLSDDCLYTPNQAYDEEMQEIVSRFNDALEGKNIDALVDIDFEELTFAGSRTNHFLQQILMLIHFKRETLLKGNYVHLKDSFPEKLTLDYIRLEVLERKGSSKESNIDALTNLPKDVPSPQLEEPPEILSESDIEGNDIFKERLRMVKHVIVNVLALNIPIYLVKNKTSFSDGESVFFTVHRDIDYGSFTGVSIDEVVHEVAHVLEGVLLRSRVSVELLEKVLSFILFLNPGRELRALIKKIKAKQSIVETDIYELRQLVKMPKKNGIFHSTHSNSLDTPFGFLYRILLEMVAVKWFSLEAKTS